MDKRISASGMSAGDVLAIAFIILKLAHVIDWSWWWVLSPIWIGFLIFFVISMVWGVIHIVKYRTSRQVTKPPNPNPNYKPPVGKHD